MEPNVTEKSPAGAAGQGKPPHPRAKARIKGARKKRRPTRAQVEAALKFQAPVK